MDQIDQLRKSFETPRVVAHCSRARAQIGRDDRHLDEVVNGETRGMFILSAEPKELTIVLILGPFEMDDLGKLHGIGGLGALADVDVKMRHEGQGKGQDKDKVKKDGDQ